MSARLPTDPVQTSVQDTNKLNMEPTIPKLALIGFAVI